MVLEMTPRSTYVLVQIQRYSSQCRSTDHPANTGFHVANSFWCRLLTPHAIYRAFRIKGFPCGGFSGDGYETPSRSGSYQGLLAAPRKWYKDVTGCMISTQTTLEEEVWLRNTFHHISCGASATRPVKTDPVTPCII